MKPAASVWIVSLLACFGLGSCGQNEAGSKPESIAAQPLVLYSSLAQERVNAIKTAYTDASGVAMYVMLESAPVLIEKLENKAHRPPADVLLISGVGQLVAAVEVDVLRPTHADQLTRNIPATLRDPDGYWFGLAARAVTLVYDKRLVDPATLSDFASLADEQWEGRLCLPSSGNENSRTLVASLLAVLGERDAELIVRRWQKNRMGPVFSSGRDLLLAVEAGRCPLGIVDSNTLATFIAEDGAEHIGLHWPSAADGGVPLSLTGAGVTRHATSPQLAVDFLAWLSSEEGQRILTESGRDFPVNPRVTSAVPLNGGGEFAVSPIESVRLGYLLPDVLRLNERARYR